MRWRRVDVLHLTLKELLVQTDSYMLYSWDQTSQISGMLEGVVSTLINCHSSKSRSRPRHPWAFHPYRDIKKSGHILTKKSFRSVLMGFGDLAKGNK